MRTSPGPASDGFVAPQLRRFKRVAGRPYMPDVVEDVRRLVEGTGLSQAAIAARTGVGPSAIKRWIKRRRWVRPLDAARWPRAVALDRAGLGRRFRVAFERVQHLAAFEAEQLRREDPPAKAAILRAARLADGASHAASMQDTHDPGRRGWLRGSVTDAGLVRISAPPTGGQGQAYADDVVAIARNLVETTTLTNEEIAHRVGVSAATIGEWRRVGGWIRPPDAATAPPSRRWRVDERWFSRSESAIRLDEAEGVLDVLGREPRPALDGIAHVFETLLAARAAFRVGPPRRLPTHLSREGEVERTRQRSTG